MRAGPVWGAMKLSGAMLLVLLAVTDVSHTRAASEYTGDILSISSAVNDWTSDITSTSSVKISSRPCQIYKNSKLNIGTDDEQVARGC